MTFHLKRPSTHQLMIQSRNSFAVCFWVVVLALTTTASAAILENVNGTVTMDSTLALQGTIIVNRSRANNGIDLLQMIVNLNNSLTAAFSEINAQQHNISLLLQTITSLQTRVTSLEGNLKQIQETSLLPHNLINNGWMGNLTKTIPPTPNGYVASLVQFCPGTAISNITIEAAHPYTSCFEGPYTPTAPVNYSTTCDNATATHPFWFGSYYTGPRQGRGGLAGGWGNFAKQQGNILRIRGYRAPGFCIVPWVKIPLSVEPHPTRQLLFRAWVKIDVGLGFYFGEDFPSTQFSVFKSDTDLAVDRWAFVNFNVYTSGLSGTGLTLIPYGNGSVSEYYPGIFDLYIALPFLGNTAGPGNWVASVEDVQLWT